jgi:hypothetical protein
MRMTRREGERRRRERRKKEQGAHVLAEISIIRTQNRITLSLSTTYQSKESEIRDILGMSSKSGKKREKSVRL